MRLVLIYLICFVMVVADEVRLVNQQSGFVPIEEVDGEVVFNDPLLEVEMIVYGVVIPTAHRERYHSGERIKLGENSFFKAFKEFYVPFIYDSCIYQWEEGFVDDSSGD